MRSSGPEILGVLDALSDAYVEIFTAPPWAHRSPAATRHDFRERLKGDAHRPGFRAVVAVDEAGAVAGFATGWITQAPFPADRAYGKVLRRLGADRVDELLIGSLEIDELGVRSGARRSGLGGRLLSSITATAPGGRSWLLTWSQAHDALAFYRCQGWEEPEVVHSEETDIVVFLSPPERLPEADPLEWTP
ncbi:GNAT family N-acetyltransferase [Streptomyces prasinopilosus]|uniref:GNAT family N-acetyltransferase n=1 Tax=Streptomyces prasinopilosus TaxID=67344 RepID=UPI0006EBACE6|nr:GNAT family N-acetyltransferase [Streptomyces prasinopilosus]